MAKKPNKNDDGIYGDREFLLHVLSFHGTRWSFDGGYVISFELKETPVTPFRPFGFSYAFNLFGPDARGEPKVRLYAVDNAHAAKGVALPYDHEHETEFGPGGRPVGVGKPKARPMVNMQLSITDFFEKCKEKLISWDVDVNAKPSPAASTESQPPKKPAKPKGGASRAHSKKTRKTK